MLFDEDNLAKFLNEVTESWTCPLCAEKGISSQVKLYQTNDEQAIYFCESPECTYPQTDDSEPFVVNRPIIDHPVDALMLEEIGLPTSMLAEGELSLANAYELLLVSDAYNQYDDWARLEKDLQKLKERITKEAASNKIWESVQLQPKCTPLNRLRSLPDELIKFAKHVIPNIEEVINLLRLDIL